MTDRVTYRKSFQEVSRDRDFYGFVLREGEARIEADRLVVTERHNDPMTERQGADRSTTYGILERFPDAAGPGPESPESGKLKVASDDGAPEIFDLSEARFLREPEWLRLTCDRFDPKKPAHRARGLRLLADHARLLHGAEAAVADALERALAEVASGAAADVHGFHVLRRGERYHLHRDGSPFVMNATLTRAGWIFAYPWISYYFPGLATRVREHLAQGAWRAELAG